MSGALKESVALIERHARGPVSDCALPRVTLVAAEHPTDELGATGVDAAVAAAVHDAVGIHLRELPITSARALGALGSPASR